MDEGRDFGVRALTEAWNAQDLERLSGAFSLCVELGVVDEEIRRWYVRAWCKLVSTYQAEGREWRRKPWTPDKSRDAVLAALKKNP